MHTGLKITAFAAALAATFGSAYAVGGVMDPAVAEQGPSHQDGHGAKEAAEKGAGEKSAGEATELPGGLQVSQGGYALDLSTPRVEAGEPAELRFAVVDEDTSRKVTAFRREHDKDLHLIVASSDLTTYRHLHPERAADGTWSTPVELPEAGGYRVFADFTPDVKNAEGITLGADLAVSGDARPEALPEAERTATVDGYEVTLDGALRPGAGSELKLEVEKDGKPVTDLQPYLGAYGHLVALRAGDLAYLHVHPNGEPGDGRTKPGPEVSFTATAPSKGAYRLFLDFRHEGKVRTAAFTVHAGGAAAGEPVPENGESAEHGH
ncbi:hypothetical protein [Streptomyces sp. VB1]|uniref:hypothetical protein n=1 Tax=Streptomyces sp. VB1 TaxID=2986803 RepID=UPI0022429A48|nr:hypothetical protein [Streptomyces sp. VB1]UZI27910.1 hypothetical protein OH133_07090 [Streptomyces sp. VB1]